MLQNSVRLLLFACYCYTSCYAAAFSIIPKAPLPTRVILGTQVKAYYTVTNSTLRDLNQIYVKYLPNNVTQVTQDPHEPILCGKQFSLKSGQSCTLELSISGSVNGGNSNPQQHLFICHPNIPSCAGTNYPLNVQAVTATVKGRVQSGPNSNFVAIADATVQLWRANTQGAAVIASTTSDSQGNYYLYVEPTMMANQTASVYYLTATKGNTISLVSMIGNKLPAEITINELTTVASAYANAQFFQNFKLIGSTKSLDIASQMSFNLVNPTTGSLSDFIQKSPNADETNTQRELSSLANLLIPCVRNGGASCNTLFTITTFQAVVPQHTLDAMLSIARHPANNTLLIYNEANNTHLYTPDLSTMNAQGQKIPDTWTVAVKFNRSGDDSNCPFGGPGGIVQDENGFLWITNNTVQGTPNSINCMIVLQANGQPAQGPIGLPFSPIFGGGLLGGGFGNAIAPNKHVWQANFGWGDCANCLPDGSATELSSSGIAISGPNGYQSKAPNDLFRVQGIRADNDNNIWMSSFGNGKVVVFLKGNPNQAVSYQQENNSGPFGIAIAKNGDAWVSNTGATSIKQSTNTLEIDAFVAIYRLVNKQLVQIKKTKFGGFQKAINFDSFGNAWVSSQHDNKVYQLNPNGDIVNSYSGGGIIGPWGLGIDGNDHVWIGNFQTDNTIFRVSELCGNQTTTCPNGSNVGDAISPNTGYTLPTGGDIVRLPDGSPLRAGTVTESRRPLMRQTYLLIDPAGNVWVTNNWKPIPFDDLALNPGGDGLVTFVGMAKPPQS